MNTSLIRTAAPGGPPTALSLLNRSSNHTNTGPDGRHALRGPLLQALLVLGLVLGGAGWWVAGAPLAGAVIAQGVVKNERNRKVIQHQEGGIVSEILVKDGQQVRAGEILTYISDVRSNANRDVLRAQYAAELLRKKRLEAEVDLAASFNAAAFGKLAGAEIDLVGREQRLFDARRRNLDEQVSSMQAQAVEVEGQITGLKAQQTSNESGLKLARDELKLNEELAQQGYVQKTRLLTLERTVVEYDSRMGSIRSDLAAAQQKIQDLQLRATQARNSYQQQAADELKDATVKARELEERLRASEDLANRQAVRAPVAGTVMNLRVTGPGLNVGPREPLMEIVPAEERLVIESRVRLEDIAHVRVGTPAEVRLTAYEHRRTPTLPATVDFVSADRIEDPQSHTSWFIAQVSIPPEELAKHPDIALQPGMPTEVHVMTPARSMLSYLLGPIDAFRARALREP
jgi:HlyD family type I secretion membrane fusion protein